VPPRKNTHRCSVIRASLATRPLVVLVIRIQVGRECSSQSHGNGGFHTCSPRWRPLLRHPPPAFDSVRRANAGSIVRAAQISPLGKDCCTVFNLAHALQIINRGRPRGRPRRKDKRKDQKVHVQVRVNHNRPHSFKTCPSAHNRGNESRCLPNMRTSIPASSTCVQVAPELFHKRDLRVGSYRLRQAPAMCPATRSAPPGLNRGQSALL